MTQRSPCSNARSIIDRLHQKPSPSSSAYSRSSQPSTVARSFAVAFCTSISSLLLPGTAAGPVAGKGEALAERQHRRHRQRRDLCLDRRERFGRQRDFGPPQERCPLRLLLVGEGGRERRQIGRAHV